MNHGFRSARAGMQMQCGSQSCNKFPSLRNRLLLKALKFNMADVDLVVLCWLVLSEATGMWVTLQGRWNPTSETVPFHEFASSCSQFGVPGTDRLPKKARCSYWCHNQLSASCVSNYMTLFPARLRRISFGSFLDSQSEAIALPKIVGQRFYIWTHQTWKLRLDEHLGFELDKSGYCFRRSKRTGFILGTCVETPRSQTLTGKYSGSCKWYSMKANRKRMRFHLQVTQALEPVRMICRTHLPCHGIKSLNSRNRRIMLQLPQNIDNSISIMAYTKQHPRSTSMKGVQGLEILHLCEERVAPGDGKPQPLAYNFAPRDVRFLEFTLALDSTR